MPESNGSPSAAERTPSASGMLLAVYGRVFGVPEDALVELRATEKDGEIWASSQDPPRRVRTRRPPGLRALRRMPDGVKPTSTFLMALADRIRAARIEVDLETLRKLLLGRRIEVDHPDSYVAVAYDGLVLGCGRVQRSELHVLIPTGRRRELLEVLEARTPPQVTKL
ncbi:MAG: hypothetical protein PHV11_03665 [Candidatus Bipolaricaulis sp.]|nr:hypothetical protein [Candidatus Bipolaricaulis sp.]MDD5219646.1 hypothetical protein [Candidatus Bipolaricaulis sp.]MDD5646176.1 hypothetical protein [Candidatus Bipolaricaulis sp.]